MQKTTILCSIAIAALSVATARDASAGAEEGRALYETKCKVCHSIGSERGKMADKGGPLDGVGSKLTADEIRDWLLKPAEMAAKHKATRKPLKQPYTKLAKEDIDALVAYVQSLKK